MIRIRLSLNTSLTTNRPVALGEFVLEPGARQVTRSGAPIHLTGKAYDLLALLVARRPEAVSKRDIYATLWGDTFVADANLPALIFELRAALGESARQPRFIRTVHGFGYAFDSEPPPPTPLAPTSRIIVGGESIALTPGVHLVGRSRQCTVRFDSSKVSRVHARITVHGTVTTVEDLGSRNGTFVGGDRIAQPIALADGDEIIFGSEAARFEATVDSAVTEPADT